MLLMIFILAEILFRNHTVNNIALVQLPSNSDSGQTNRHTLALLRLINILLLELNALDNCKLPALLIHERSVRTQSSVRNLNTNNSRIILAENIALEQFKLAGLHQPIELGKLQRFLLLLLPRIIIINKTIN